MSRGTTLSSTRAQPSLYQNRTNYYGTQKASDSSSIYQPSSTRRRLSTSVEPSTTGTSWASVRWNRPVNGTFRDRMSRLNNAFEPSTSTAGKGVSYTGSSYSASPARNTPERRKVPTPPERRYLSTNTASNMSSIPTTNRYGRSNGSTIRDEISSTSRNSSRGSPMSSTRTSRVSVLTDTNSRNGGVSYLTRRTPPRSTLLDIRQNLRPVKKEAETYTKTPPPKNPYLSSVSQRVSDFSQYFSPPTFTTGPSTTMAITNAIGNGVTPKAIPKSERPWRQRLADSARLREAQSSGPSAEESASKFMAARADRASRRQSIGKQSSHSRQSSTDTPEQQLHGQLAALRHIVEEDKNRVRGADGSLSKHRGAAMTTALGSMPSTVRWRTSFMANSMNSSAAPSTTSIPNVMSKSYSPVRSSFFSSADSNASTALYHYNQSREKNVADANKRYSTISPPKAPMALPEAITDAKTPPPPNLPEDDNKTGERRRRSRSARRQNSALAAALEKIHSSSSSDEEKHTSRHRPSRKSSKETKTRSEIRTPVQKSSQDTSTVPATPANKTPEAKMVADNSTKVKRNLPEDTKKVEKKPTTPITKRKKKEADEPQKKVTGVLTIPVVDKTDVTKTPTNVDEDESKYNAVTKFKPTYQRKKSPEVEPVPVPGTWEVQNEAFISKNKQLARNPATITVEVVCKQLQLERLPPKLIRLLPAKKKVPPTKQKVTSSITKKAADDKDNVAILLKPKTEPRALKIIKSIAKPKKLATALAIVNQDFTNKKRLRLGIEKILRIKGLKTDKLQFKCQHAKNTSTAILLNIVFKQQKRTASVTILSAAITGVNWTKVERNLKASVAAKPTLKNREAAKVSAAAVSTHDKENLGVVAHSSNKTDSRILPPSQTILTKKHDGKMPVFVKNTHIPCNHTAGAPIVLPDKSLLEEYVQRKRNELENLHTSDDALLSTAESSRCDSPGLISFGSESYAAPPVDPTIRTTIARVVSPPRSRFQSGDQKPSTSSQNLTRNQQVSQHQPPVTKPIAGLGEISRQNVAPPGVLLRNQLKKPAEIPKNTVVFEAPKSLFEQRMQNQAVQLRKTTQASTDYNKPSSFPVYDTDDLPSIAPPDVKPTENMMLRRRSSTEKSPNVAQNFTAAVNQPRQPERYAAHIPLPLSGRQSTTSVDSSNSGALDTAGRQLDQMIDQARYRHHQHRSKFKEAIEYLDHIFEDLKKECDKGSFGSQENQNAAQNVESKPAAPKPNTGGNPSAKSMFDKQQQRAVDVHNKDPNIHTRTLPAKATANAKWPRTAQTAEKAPGVAPRQAPANAIQRVPQQQQSGVPPQDGHRQNIGQKLAQKHPQNGGDVEVSETIVLPSKNTSDRLDFTRQWLVDDIKSWADNPNKKPDLILGSDDQMGIQYDDNNGSDEHSLGSCSAEVAAINASEKRKKARETPDIIKSSKTQPIKPKQAQQPPPKNTFAHQKSMPEPQVVPNPAPIRPQPFRPQPQFAIYPPSGAESIYELQKVPSHEQLRSRYSQERAASQDYQSLGSVHSQDGFKPASSTYLSTNSLHRGGAFVNYNPTRGSIHSLPDAALLTVNQPPLPQNASRFWRPAPNDHVLAIDALVAELELNTDAPSAIDKRRSFPTTHGEVTSGPGNRRDFGQNAQHQQSALKGNAQSMTKVGPATISIQRQTNPPNKAPVNQPSQSAGLRNSMKQPERSHQQNSLDEVAEMLRDVSDPHHKQTLQPSNQQVHPQTPSPRKFSNPRTGVAVSGEKKVANPFETINQERVNPSRVEAISNMFEGGGKPGVPSSVSTWSKKMARNSSKDTSSEAEDYNAGNSVSEKPKLRGVNIHPIFRQQTTSPQNSDNKVKLRQKPGQVSVQAPFPTTQHPAGLKGKVVPQNGVQFAANSGVGSSSNRNSRGDSLMGKTPNSSVNPQSSADDDDIYDNLPTENRFSQLSEMDDASLCSQNLPPAHKSAGGRFGQLIRKIGGTTGITKPPVHNAASFASLNKVSNDTPMHGRQIGLMKSNSLSNEPWRIHAMKQEEPSESKSMGIGNRLKQTIFGSKKRLQT